MIFFRMDMPSPMATKAETNGITATQGLATTAMTSVRTTASGKSMRVNNVEAV